MTRLFLAPIVLAVVACTPAPISRESAGAPPADATETEPTLIGVLEDRTGSTTSEERRFIVRAVFRKDTDGWKSLEPQCNNMSCLASSPADFPQAVDWTIVYDGTTHGSVRATTPPAWQLYADVGSQELEPGVAPPLVGERSAEFAGNQGQPTYRPLLATSFQSATDPDSWDATGVPRTSVTAISAAFRGLFTNVLNCATGQSNDAQPATYTDSGIKISNSTAAANGWIIATARLDEYRCDGPLDDTAFAPQTFAVSPEGEARYLGEGLQFVDAGDFDGDGRSEVVFAITRGNQGGYDLRYNDFANQAVFAFSYH
jgi:hypothetical protein